MSDSSVWTPARHPLARLLRDLVVNGGQTQDGLWTRVTPWAQPLQGTLSFSGHCVLAVSYDFTDEQLKDLGADTAEGALNPRIITRLAGESGWIDCPRVILASAGTASSGNDSALVSRNDLGQEPLVEYARRVHQQLQVFGESNPEQRHIVTLGRGLGGAREIAVQRDSDHPSHSIERLVTQARACIPENELVVSCVEAGHAASIAAHQEAGFTLIGSAQLFSSRPETAA